jgi:hypothetical protein
MMAVILRGQGFPGQLLTKGGKYDDVEPRSVWLRAMPLSPCESSGIRFAKRNLCSVQTS